MDRIYSSAILLELWRQKSDRIVSRGSGASLHKISPLVDLKLLKYSP